MRSSRLFFDAHVTGRMRCAIFLLLASLRAAAGAAGDYCASDFPDDVYTESCYGWCDVLNSESHCAYCKCRGCAFCAARRHRRRALRGVLFESGEGNALLNVQVRVVQILFCQKGEGEGHVRDIGRADGAG